MMDESFDKKEKQRRWLVVGLWVGMLVYVALVPGSPVEGIYQCPFHAITGYSCPGCGMTRASIHAVQGDLASSFEYHPFGVVFVLGLSLIALFRLAELIRGRPLTLGIIERTRPYHKKLWLGVLIVACLFGFGRLALEIAGILTPL